MLRVEFKTLSEIDCGNRVYLIDGPMPHHIGGGDLAESGCILDVGDWLRAEMTARSAAMIYASENPPRVHIHDFELDQGVDHFISSDSPLTTDVFAVSLLKQTGN